MGKQRGSAVSAGVSRKVDIGTGISGRVSAGAGVSMAEVRDVVYWGVDA